VRLKIVYSFLTVAMFFSLSLAFEHKAYAYVDPGSGLLMLQAAGTILTGVLFTLRRRIKALFTRNKPTEASAIEATAPNTKA
jgi:hypothetical protein